MLGSMNAFDPVAKDIAVESGMLVVSVDYRLSPETRFPLPVHVSC